eukprot:scaffold119461_cov82-Phaeocystis_antarctica.AAC.3
MCNENGEASAASSHNDSRAHLESPGRAVLFKTKLNKTFKLDVELDVPPGRRGFKVRLYSRFSQVWRARVCAEPLARGCVAGRMRPGRRC